MDVDELELYTENCSSTLPLSPVKVPAVKPRRICHRAVASPESPMEVPAIQIHRRAVASPESPLEVLVVHARHRLADTTGNESSFNLTADTIYMPEDVHENSIQDPTPMEVPLGHCELEFNILEKGTQRGKPLLVDSRGYTYTIQDGRKAPAVVYWWCSVRTPGNRCRATIVQKNDTFYTGRHEHNHQVTVGVFTKKRIALRLREVAREGDFYRSSHSMAEQIYIEESKPDEPCPTLPPLRTAARTVNHNRQKLRPKEPKDLSFELEHRAIPDDFICEDIMTGRGSRHLVFATQEQLRTLTTAKTWFVDCTFQLVSKPFTQLLSIHAFLTSGGKTKQVPLLFTLMSSRTKDDYITVFKAIRNLLGEDIALERMTSDFEVAMWKGFRAVFPGVPVKGCSFHFNQAIYRKIQDLGLAAAYNEDVATHKFCTKLMALPFLHMDHVRPTFEMLREQQETEGLRNLCEYVDNTWIMNTTYRLQDWCVFGQAIRTNDDLEAWHRRLNQKAARKNLPLYSLVLFLKTEADQLPMQSQLLTDEQLDWRQTPAQKKTARKYFELWDEYMEGNLTPSQLLCEVSNMNEPVCQ